MPTSVHPPSETKQLSISFWSYGDDKLDSSSRTSILESGTAQRRALNIHFPYNSRLYWHAGYDNSVDNINKPFENPDGQWDYWTFQKKMLMPEQCLFLGMVSNGMKVLIQQDLWVEMLKSFVSVLAEMEGNRWSGLMDELRIRLTLETEDSILASYESQRPDSNFTFFDQVYGPPTLIQDQLAEGFVGEGTFSYILKVFPSANEFTALGLPAGISINSSTGEIYGEPLQGGNFQVTVTAKNEYGEDQGIVILSIVDKTGFSHSAELVCSDYNGTTTLHDFPLLIRLDSSVPNFSLKSFSSEYCYDLRFYDQFRRELVYEIDEIDHINNSLTAWVKVFDLNQSTIVSAYWGNSLLK